MHNNDSHPYFISNHNLVQLNSCLAASDSLFCTIIVLAAFCWYLDAKILLAGSDDKNRNKIYELSIREQKLRISVDNTSAKKVGFKFLSDYGNNDETLWGQFLGHLIDSE